MPFVAADNLFAAAQSDARSFGFGGKEMGIRKVLGASRWNLFYQLVKGFLLLLLIAVLIALPLAWFSMNAWLSHYAFRTEVIMSKPARSLRYE